MLYQSRTYLRPATFHTPTNQDKLAHITLTVFFARISGLLSPQQYQCVVVNL